MIPQIELDKLAKLPKMSTSELEERLVSLEYNKASLLQCIKFVKDNQGLDLKEASIIVLESKAMDEKREGIIKHQEEMFEELIEYNGGNIESMKTAFTEKGDFIELKLKKKL